MVGLFEWLLSKTFKTKLNFIELWPMELIDTHCHLYVEEFKEDMDIAAERAFAEGVSKIFLPAIDSSEHRSMFELEVRHPGKCLAMMGLHPCYVKENFDQELALVESWLQKRSFAAIGEIGLDFYWDRNYDSQQYEAFRRQITWAKQYGLPIVIHSRNSTQECLHEVKAAQTGSLFGIFHCFSGSYELAKEIIDIGFYLGIGGVVTYKNSKLPEVLAKIPIESIVLETDAPYLTPVPFRGKRNEPAYLKFVVDKLAEIYHLDSEEVAAITTSNALKIFKSTTHA